jgi:hypothetical protein
VGESKLFAEVVIIEVSHDLLLIFPMPAAMAVAAKLLVCCGVLSHFLHYVLTDGGEAPAPKLQNLSSNTISMDSKDALDQIP